MFADPKLVPTTLAEWQKQHYKIRYDYEESCLQAGKLFHTWSQQLFIDHPQMIAFRFTHSVAYGEFLTPAPAVLFTGEIPEDDISQWKETTQYPPLATGGSMEEYLKTLDPANFDVYSPKSVTWEAVNDFVMKFNDVDMFIGFLFEESNWVITVTPEQVEYKDYPLKAAA